MAGKSSGRTGRVPGRTTIPFVSPNRTPGMRRRLLLALLAATPGIAGCLASPPGGRDSDGPPTTETGTTPGEATAPAKPRPDCEDPPAFDDPVTVRAGTTDAHTATGTSTPGFDLRVRHAGGDPAVTRTVAVSIARLSGGDCEAVAFARTYRVEPGERIDVADPVGAGGRYRLTATLRDGPATTEVMTLPDGGIADPAGYLVTVVDGGVEIHAIVV